MHASRRNRVTTCYFNLPSVWQYRPPVNRICVLATSLQRSTNRTPIGGGGGAAGKADLAGANRLSSMGELTASLAHEGNQPIAAAITDANTCMRWLPAINLTGRRRVLPQELYKRECVGARSSSEFACSSRRILCSGSRLI